MTGGARATVFRAFDGLSLSGTIMVPAHAPTGAVVLVHGGGVTREEGGLYTRVALALAGAGFASLRFDLRGHGESGGRQEDLTLAGILNDIHAATAHLRITGAVSGPVDLIAMSFSGGISAFFAAQHPDEIRRLVLLNPLVNYKRRFIDDKPYWHHDQIDEAAGQELALNGFIPHSPSFKLGRPLLNELFHLRPHEALGDISTPTFIVHGTRDTFIPIESSRQCAKQIPGAKLLEIEGAQHGFAVHDDPRYSDPQTQEWQAIVIKSAVDWLSESEQVDGSDE